MPAGIRLTTCQCTTSSRSARSEVVEWGGTQSKDGRDIGGVTQGWVFICRAALGFMCVRMVRGHVGMVRMSQDGQNRGFSDTQTLLSEYSLPSLT